MVRAAARRWRRQAVVASREIVQQPAEQASDPIIEYASGATAAVGQPFTFTVLTTSANDAQCGLVLSLEGHLPAGLSTPGCGYGEIVGTPAIDINGTDPVDLVAGDAGRSFSPAPFVLTVSAGEPEPSAVLPATTLALPAGLAVPGAVSYGRTEVWDALANRVLGDCVEAASEHLASRTRPWPGAATPRPCSRRCSCTPERAAARAARASGSTRGGPCLEGIGGQVATAVAQLADPADEQDLTEALWLTGARSPSSTEPATGRTRAPSPGRPRSVSPS